MELRLQEFIESVERLSAVRNLDQFNPIFFRMQHPVSAIEYIIVGSKVTPSYLGVPINVVWVVLDPTNPYYRQALKLRDTIDTDTVTSLPKEEPANAWWHVVRTYDGIWAGAQYYIGAEGQKGDKGDKGDPGPAGPAGPAGEFDANAFLQQAFAMLTELPGTLTIMGPDNISAGSQNQYDVFLDQQEFVDGVLTLVHKQVYPHIMIIGTPPNNVSISQSNVLIAGAVAQDTTITLAAYYPSWTRMLDAFKEVQIKAAVPISLTIAGNNPIYAGKSEILTATVTFSDGTTALVTPNWSVDDTASASINTAGRITGQVSIVQDTTVTVTATYNYGNGQILTATAPVLIRKLVLTGLTVLGATSIPGNATSAYTARATYNSGDTAIVSASWAVDNPIATINGSGVLTPTNVSGVVTVTATHTDLSGTRSASLNVTITAVIAQIAPFYGVGAALPPDWSVFVNSLSHRGSPGSLDTVVQIDAIGSDTYMYFAAPVSLGTAQFFDNFSNFFGGWGGAGNSGQGPSQATTNSGGQDTPVQANVVINGTPVPFYIYRTDYPNMGPASGNKWTVSPTP